MLARRRLGPLRALAIAACALVALVLYFSLRPWAISAAAPGQAPLLPAEATTSFLTAYAAVDEDLADSLSSPLYQAEWVRRGLDARARASIRGGNKGSADRASLHFEYVGGVLTAEGFGTYLYAVWPIKQGSGERGHYSVWRVDADPQGRVIWLELVWLFSEDTRQVVRVDDAGLLARVPAPVEAITAGLRPVVGVASEDTGEGYYLIGPKANGLGASAYVPAKTYAVDGSGAIRPGAWTFGLGDPGVWPYPPRQAPKLQVEPRDEALLEGYLRALG